MHFVCIVYWVGCVLFAVVVKSRGQDGKSRTVWKLICYIGVSFFISCCMIACYRASEWEGLRQHKHTSRRTGTRVLEFMGG